MQQGASWDTNSSSTSQEFQCSVRYSHSAQLVPTHSQNNLVHGLPLHFLNIYFNIILPPISRSSKWLFPSDFPIKSLYTFIFSHVSHALPSSSLLIISPKQYYCEEYKIGVFITQFSPASHYLLLGPHIFLSTLFSNTLNKTSSLHVKAIPLQAWTGPEGSRRLRLPDFKIIGTWRW